MASSCSLRHQGGNNLKRVCLQLGDDVIDPAFRRRGNSIRSIGRHLPHVRHDLIDTGEIARVAVQVGFEFERSGAIGREGIPIEQVHLIAVGKARNAFRQVGAEGPANPHAVFIPRQDRHTLAKRAAHRHGRGAWLVEPERHIGLGRFLNAVAALDARRRRVARDLDAAGRPRRMGECEAQAKPGKSLPVR
ncbi:hypothetical protein LZK82_02365 [Rhizobium leguminosarum]|nr:hypothetical protein LZK82_02365 [Rhizobium leguminosarum]